MNTKIEKVTIRLRGHYDKDKTATVRADYNGYDYYISRRAMKAAERRALIIEGDYLEMVGHDGMLIVE
jgi:hypothetical protein